MDRPDDANPGAPAQRAGDADRERAAELLRTAGAEGRLTVDELEERLTGAFAARTRSELEVLLADVSEHAQLASTGGPSAVTPSGTPETRFTVAIMGGSKRRGVWRPAENGTVINVMGGCDIDLTEAELAHPVTRIRVLSIMGGGEIRVPDGVAVHVSKLAIMGGNDVKLGPETAAPGARTVRLQLISIMGGVKVRRGASKRRRKQLAETDRDPRRLEP